MKSIILKISVLVFTIALASNVNEAEIIEAQDFQGQAVYFSKAKMELGNFGKGMSEAQVKQIAERLKNRLEKKYVLTFNKEESLFYEDEKLDAMSGATDSWGKNFTPGKQYKNVKINSQVQSQEFYGKQFLVKDNLQPIEWVLGSETKQIGKYACFKATASVPTNELTWYDFSWDRLTSAEAKKIDSTTAGVEGNNIDLVEESVNMTDIEAWYTPQIPVGHGPSEYWGLPGLILEVSAGNQIMLCTKIIMNPEEKIEIEAPDKGKEITKNEYQATITEKMKEFRNNRGRSRG
jgi:GLPGLI family protein